MLTMGSTHKTIREWFADRGISLATLNENGISWDIRGIIIPIYNHEKQWLFNKYRRNPFIDSGPKYKYDRGSSSTLYGIHHQINKFAMDYIICEGELDAIRLWEENIPAVTSTGGSGSFESSWIAYFNKRQVTICLDYDEAGIKGAFNIQAKIPWAKIAWLPEGKDITDFLKEKSVKELQNIFLQAKTYWIPPNEQEEFTTKKAVKEAIDKIKGGLEIVMQEGRELREAYKTDNHIQILVNYYLNRIQDLQHTMKYMGKPKINYGNRIEQAKQVPIPHYIKFNREGYANCIWHNEKTPSMYYYPKQNRVKCFGCDKMGDVIDVVKHQNGVELQEALNIILGKDEV